MKKKKRRRNEEETREGRGTKTEKERLVIETAQR